MERVDTDPSKSDLPSRWAVLTAAKGDLISRCENYARLTEPYLCPALSSEGQEYVKGEVAIGARLVNHLANKVVETMFPSDRPNFAIALTPEARQRLRKEAGEEGEALFAEQVRGQTAMVEDLAMRKMNLTAYRPQAVEAAKHLQVTGNAVIYRLPSGDRVIYGIKNFCVQRDIRGKPIELMLEDATTVGALEADIRQLYKNVHTAAKDTDTVTMLTAFKKVGARWKLRQAVGTVPIERDTHFTEVKAPFIVLTWTLARGEHYGRGLVESSIVAFHNIDVYSLAMQEMVGVMADIKFLVDPASGIDPMELNNSPRGSYHSGRKDDISTPEGARSLEINLIRDIIKGYEQELAQTFLLNSSNVRDAERVTAEEIRFISQELESAFGGLYSRLALEWQRQEAEYAVSLINFDKELGAGFSIFEIVITTGIESLSRDGQLANVRRAIADLQMLDTVPEDVRGTINPAKFASFVFTNHTVRWKEFQYTADEMKANQENAMKQEERLAGIQANAKAQGEVGKRVVQES